MFDFNKPKIEIAEISEDKKYGRFVVEPLERGYGTTLGNSLRRIMLSSLPGAAVSQVKIEGVLHEFSSIPGVKEDVTEIIMNIKSLAIKNSSETNEPKVAYIEFDGEGTVTGADIQADQDIEIMNPDQVIATLNGGADSKLYMELTITKGRGYVSTVLVSNGTLNVGDIVIAGTSWGRIKAMFNERNQRIEKAAPSEPAIILGLNGAPTAGDTFHVMETEQEAREIANKREQLQREQGLRTQTRLTLSDIYSPRAMR